MYIFHVHYEVGRFLLCHRIVNCLANVRPLIANEPAINKLFLVIVPCVIFFFAKEEPLIRFAIKPGCIRISWCTREINTHVFDGSDIVVVH